LTLRFCAFLAAVAVLAGPASADAARFAVGLAPGVDVRRVRAEIELRGGRVESLAPVPALVADMPGGKVPPRLRGVRYVERLGERRLAVTFDDPFLPRQWYVEANRTFDSWEVLPPLAPVRVAVIDSGVDLGHPELVNRVAAARSFVGGSPRDTEGHGTFVAGLIGAETNNQTGVAGMAPGAELLVAKVVTSKRTIPVEAEAKAIRWAVANGARVINMSLGGVRDPTDPSRDTYSPLEADAIAYATSENVVVVAAVGNSDQAPERPWRFASYPAALPHVLGVSALTRDGASPEFSNRDAVFNDLAAPGQEIMSTFPRSLTAARPQCPEQGYSPCGTDEYRAGEGTSFAAPQVSAAAATIIGTRADLTAEQVTAVLSRSATDVSAATGCRQCPLGRDPLTGWGRLDVSAALAALAGPLPHVDALEPNDDAGKHAYALWGSKRRIIATLDYWDDQSDVYRVHLQRGQRLFASLVGPERTDTSLALWRPGTLEVDDLAQQVLRARLASRPGPDEFLAYRAPVAGFYYLHVKITAEGAGAYRLTILKRTD
jgi:subtilisin family serine protease